MVDPGHLDAFLDAQLSSILYEPFHVFYPYNGDPPDLLKLHKKVHSLASQSGRASQKGASVWDWYYLLVVEGYSLALYAESQSDAKAAGDAVSDFAALFHVMQVDPLDLNARQKVPWQFLHAYRDALKIAAEVSGELAQLQAYAEFSRGEVEKEESKPRYSPTAKADLYTDLGHALVLLHHKQGHKDDLCGGIANLQRAVALLEQAGRKLRRDTPDPGHHALDESPAYVELSELVKKRSAATCSKQ